MNPSEFKQSPSVPERTSPCNGPCPALVCLRDVEKRYESAPSVAPALRGVNLAIGPGRLTAIVGKSGSGKSTLLNLVTAVDHPTRGEIIIGGVPVHTLNETSGARWRSLHVGIVFQFFQLLPTLTVLENVVLPMTLASRIPAKEREARARSLLARVGIAEQARKLPTMLSGGQQQRCAIARALANDPMLLVADEPTGNLDSRTADDVIQLLREMADGGKTVVVVTHERDIGRIADRVVTLADGVVVEDEVGTWAKRRMGT